MSGRGWSTEESVRERAEAGLQALVSRQAIPTVKNENYRYTNLKALDWDRQPVAKSELASIPKEYASLNDGEIALALSRAGCEDVSVNSLGGHQAWVGDWRRLLDSEPEFLERFPEVFQFVDRYEDDPFVSLVSARWQSGIVVYVPPGVALEGVVRGLHSFSEEVGTFIYRTILLVDEGAELNYIDEWIGSGRSNGLAPLATGSVQVIAKAGAKVRYSQVQNWGPRVQSFARQDFQVGRDAQVEITTISMGGEQNQVRLETDCREPGAEVRLKGAARGDEKQHFDFWANAIHDTNDTSSEMEYWTVMADSARSVFNGNMVITQKGVRTDASQKNYNMLLSKKAEIDTLPKLEIATDDVKCAHGASISPVDETQLFYLQARGVPLDEAKAMIVDGFTEPALSILPTAGIRSRARQAMAKGARTVLGGESE